MRNSPRHAFLLSFVVEHSVVRPRRRTHDCSGAQDTCRVARIVCLLAQRNRLCREYASEAACAVLLRLRRQQRPSENLDSPGSSLEARLALRCPAASPKGRNRLYEGCALRGGKRGAATALHAIMQRHVISYVRLVSHHKRATMLVPRNRPGVECHARVRLSL